MTTFSEREFHLFHANNKDKDDEKEGKKMILRAVTDLDRAII